MLTHPVPSWVVEPCDSGEGPGLPALRVEGTAPGWFHRAARTSRSQQWKDHEMVQPMAHLASRIGSVGPPLFAFSFGVWVLFLHAYKVFWWFYSEHICITMGFLFDVFIAWDSSLVFHVLNSFQVLEVFFTTKVSILPSVVSHWWLIIITFAANCYVFFNWVSHMPTKRL